ncbi:MAG: hypothetical protein ACEQSL_09485, partial [Sediminibacterium sp.]
MITIKKAIELCALRITSPAKGQHEHYERVVKLATLYEQLITGEDQDSLLKEYFNKESDEEIRKISAVTQPITSSVTNALISAFKKVLRTNPVVRKIDFAKDLSTKKPVIELALNSYYSGSSLDYYIEKRFHDLTFIDPNAFIITTFETVLDANGNQDLNHKPTPYPFEVQSKEAVNFGLKNGTLQFLLVEQSGKLVIYLDDHAIMFTPVEKKKEFGAGSEGEFIYGEIVIEQRNASGNFDRTTQSLPIAFVTNDKQYIIEYFTHKQGRVPAERVGYVPDKKTKGETFVNPFHYGALPFLKKSIKSVAELDLTMHCHTFPQKVIYQEGCAIDANGVCPTSGERVDK